MLNQHQFELAPGRTIARSVGHGTAKASKIPKNPKFPATENWDSWSLRESSRATWQRGQSLESLRAKRPAAMARRRRRKPGRGRMAVAPPSVEFAPLFAPLFFGRV